MKKENFYYRFTSCLVIASLMLTACQSVQGSENQLKSTPTSETNDPTVLDKVGNFFNNVNKAVVGNGNIPPAPYPTNSTPEYLKPVTQTATPEPGLRGQPVTTSPSGDCVTIWIANRTHFDQMPQQGAFSFLDPEMLMTNLHTAEDPNLKTPYQYNPDKMYWYRNNKGEALLISGKQLQEQWASLANGDIVCNP